MCRLSVQSKGAPAAAGSLLELASDSHGTVNAGAPRWLDLLCCSRSPTPFPRPSGNEAFASPAWEQHPDPHPGAKSTALVAGSLSHSSKSSSLCSSLPLPGQPGLGFGPAVSALREDFRWDPGFSYCQHPWRFGRLGLLRPGYRAGMPEASGRPAVESQMYHSL